ncbi:sugar ABC transporter substrate-binding protein, partial [Nocardioides ginsengisegetis]
MSGKEIYLVGAGDVNPWTKVYNSVIVKRLQAEGAKVTYLQDPFDPQIEVQNLDRAIAAKPYAIMLLGLDYRALTPSLTRAKQAGIPVVNMTSPATPAGELMALSVESNNPELGKFAAQNVIDGLAAQGKTQGNVIAITGTAGTEMANLRIEAFRKELATVPGLNLVAVEDGNWDQATSQKIAQQLFAKYASQGGIQAAYGMADNQALGIIQAAKQAGLSVGGADGLVVSGSNCYQAGLEAIKAGEMFGTGTQSPITEANFTVDEALKFFNGEKVETTQYAPE